MTAKVLKNFSLFVDGRGYAGKAEEVTPPKLTIKTEEFRGGGMDAPIDIDLGMEKMECQFILVDFDAELMKLFGLVDGNAVHCVMTIRSPPWLSACAECTRNLTSANSKPETKVP